VISLPLALLLAWGVLSPATPALAADPAPSGQVTWAVHFTLAPRWLDPAENEGTITPFLTLYAVHDALLKPMPSGAATPCLAESWSLSPDGLVYEFLLRSGVKFHNGETMTAEDVKFSFERYRGQRAALPGQAEGGPRPRPAAHQFTQGPWPDFITFYGTTATSAGWVVPKNTWRRSARTAQRRRSGPAYRVVSVAEDRDVLEAFEGYWRRSRASSGSSSGACPTRRPAPPRSSMATWTSRTS
jgi:peptide/nickel transport system substrate-binding protein